MVFTLCPRLGLVDSKRMLHLLSTPIVLLLSAYRKFCVALLSASTRFLRDKEAVAFTLIACRVVTFSAPQVLCCFTLCLNPIFAGQRGRCLHFDLLSCCSFQRTAGFVSPALCIGPLRPGLRPGRLSLRESTAPAGPERAPRSQPISTASAVTFAFLPNTSARSPASISGIPSYSTTGMPSLTGLPPTSATSRFS